VIVVQSVTGDIEGDGQVEGASDGRTLVRRGGAVNWALTTRAAQQWCDTIMLKVAEA
jgi:hypothetical protein